MRGTARNLGSEARGDEDDDDNDDEGKRRMTAAVAE
jgi:hypothetical protein